MLQELLDYILTKEWEWQPRKADPVDRLMSWVALCLFMSASGYICGQAICIIFDIGVVGHQFWAK